MLNIDNNYIGQRKMGLQRPSKDYIVYYNKEKIIKTKVTKEILENKCKDLKLEYIDMYKTSHDTRVKCICNKHKDKGTLDITWSHLKNATYGCKYCAGKNRNTDDFKLLIDTTKIDLLSEYIGFEKNITCKCKNCGYIFNTMPKTLIQGKYYCPHCALLYKSKNNMSQDEFIKHAYSINNNIEFLDEYKSLKIPIKCRCKICENIWYARPDNILYEHSGCPSCSSSKNENLLGDILAKYNFTFERNKSLEGCKYINHLRFDYIIRNDNNEIVFVCEYDGEQHFYPVDFSGKGEDFSKKQFDINKKRDQIKDKYCKNNNIIIIRIPYWEKLNMEKYLIEKLKENNIKYTI